MMNNDISIKVQNLTKVYHLYDKPQDRLKEVLHPFKKSYHHDFYALNDVNFEIKKAETVGIIGQNGAGKSTLLKIITGVVTPTRGNIHIKGRIASLLELGAGLNPEYTAIENIYLQGALMGFSREEMRQKVDDILDFADIYDFINQPVKSYSSGMFARLGFAIAINVEPDILIIDEALSVGDMLFQQKCIRKMKDFQKNGVTILFVSHDIATINVFCEQVLWINNGELREYGPTKEIVNKYISCMSHEEKDEHKKQYTRENKSWEHDEIFFHNTNKVERFGTKEAEITHIAFFNDKKRQNISFINHKSNDKVSIYLKFNLHIKVESLIVGFIIKNKNGQEITGLNNQIIRQYINNLTPNHYFVKFSFNFPLLSNGIYSISASIASGTQQIHTQLDWLHDCYTFEVSSLEEGMNINWVTQLTGMDIEVHNA